MGLDAGTPPGLWERVRSIAAEEVAKFMRSGFLRNASITDGGLTIRGGFLRLLSGAYNVFYAGPAGSPLADGSYEQIVTLSRRGGTIAAALFDPTGSTDGSIDQEFILFDRAGNQIYGADVSSGQGLARPYIPAVFYPAQFGGSTATTATTFTTIWRASHFKHNPKLIVGASAAPSGTTGEIRVLVDGAQFGDVQGVPAAGGAYIFGPLPVAGVHLKQILIEIQVRCVGAGSINVVPNNGVGFQS